MSTLLDQDIKYLPGVGPKRALLLNKELSIHNCGDFLYYFPYKYIDRTRIYTIKEISSSIPYIQLQGKIISMEEVGEGRKKRLVARFADQTGTVELIWFQGVNWTKQNIHLNKEYLLFGRPSSFNGKISIAHPDLEDPAKALLTETGYLQALYNTTEKMKSNFMNSKAIHKIQILMLSQLKGKIKETLPPYLISKLKLISLEEALFNIHIPTNPELLHKAQFRLKFEELFYIQLKILSLKVERSQKFKGHLFQKIGYYFNTFYKNNLPFELTGAQKRVIKEIRHDVGSGRQMNRLLQGDVGSGKTMVALMSALMATDNNYQACLMAPTEILANQHFESISQMLTGIPLKVGLLTGSTRKSERKIIHEDLLSGSLQLLIGTHALIEDTVNFRNLGLVIIDEQHRFGVQQRARLWTKSSTPPHMLVMTATPIPRTLAMTIYGDLDVSVIDELPPGRKPIYTQHFFYNKQAAVFNFIRKQIDGGRQIYIVFPLIKESEKMDYKNLEEGYQVISKAFPQPKYQVSMVHGKMKAAEKDSEMQRFVKGITQIMVATTVIEVGVNVPNASVMIIENAERFGLSQLHQLRGRVGRGSDQSYCILMSNYKLSAESKKRLNIMVESNDGFEIAEADLRLRGPGDMEGTQQSGLPFDLKIANLGRDSQILQYARDIASKILDLDESLNHPSNRILTEQLKKLNKTPFNWSAIS